MTIQTYGDTVTYTDGDGRKQIAWGMATVDCILSNGRLASSANSINAAVVASGQCRLYKVTVGNTSTTPAYLKLYDQTTTPNPASDVPIITFGISDAPTGGTTWSQSFDFSSLGFLFKNGIAYTLTQGPADTNNVPVAAGAIVGLNIFYAKTQV